MTLEERQFVLNQLDASEAHLLALVERLTPKQWIYRENPERWSIAEIMEHLTVFEEFIVQTIEKVLTQPPEPEKKSDAAAKEQQLLALAESRTTVKLQARIIVHPKGRWPDGSEIVDEFLKARRRTVAFVTETQRDLRNHFFPHIALGDLDCYQWLVVLGQHGFRHAMQIEEVKAHPAYPIAK